MFVGHLAVAFAAKTVEPRAPLGTLTAAVLGLDLLWPLLLLAGVERVRVDPGNTAFTPLAFDSYPWSHSLSMAVIYAIAAGRFSVPLVRQVRGGVLIGFAVLSHWLLDYVTHRPDLPLWPGGPLVGLGLWQSVPLTIAVEGALFAGACALYLRRTAARTAQGRWGLWAFLLLVTVIWLSGPFSPPPPGAQAIAVVGLALWLLPLWAWWIDRNRRMAGAGAPA